MVAKQPTFTQLSGSTIYLVLSQSAAVFTKQETEKSSNKMIKTEGKQSEESRCMLSENS